MEGFKTLIIDMDPQANATAGLGFTPQEDSPGIYDLLINEMPVHDTIQTTDFENLFLISADPRLHGAEIELVSKITRERILAEALAELPNDFVFIIIDCPPSLGLLTLNALSASSSILVPMQCEYFALEGLAHLMKTVKLVRTHLNPSLEIEGIVLTMYDGRLNLTKQVTDEIAEVFGSRVYKTVISRNVRLSEAPSFGKPVYVYDPSSKGAQNYRDLTAEFLAQQKLPPQEAIV
jgi:chromosome partitioning protein